MKKAVLESMCKSTWTESQGNRGRVTYGYVSSLLREHEVTYDWITRDIVNKAYSKYKKQRCMSGSNLGLDNVEVNILGDFSDDFSSISHSRASSSHQSSKTSKGGRPIGSTKENKRKNHIALVAAKNEITKRYSDLVDINRRRNKKVKRGALAEIIYCVKKKRGIDDAIIPSSTIRQRVFRKSTEIFHHSGHVSPLLEIEDTIVELVIQMARIRECLTPLLGVSLVNSLIKDCPIQRKLIEWKRKYSNNSDGPIGIGYIGGHS